MEKFLSDFVIALQAQPLTLVNLVASIVAIFSALAAWRSSKAARENLRMAKIDFEEKHDFIRAQLVDSVTWQSQQGDRIASFACNYSNAANAPNTLARLELIVSAINSNGTSITVVLDPTSEITITHRGFPQLNVPLNLAARSTVSGWVSFKLPAYLVETKRIDKYQISATTSSGVALTLDAHVLAKYNENWKN